MDGSVHVSIQLIGSIIFIILDNDISLQNILGRRSEYDDYWF